MQHVCQLTWVGLLLTWLLATSATSSQSALPSAAATLQTTASPADFQIGAAPHHAFVQSNGRILLDQMGVHWQTPKISPDGRTVAIAVIPTGSATADLAQLYLFDRTSGQRLALLAGHTPHWQGQTLTYQTGSASAAYNLATRQLTFTAAARSEQTKVANSPLAAVLGARPSSRNPPPATIRVIHHSSNACRNVPAGQIDVIPFEEYVARVVPAEMPAFWLLDALAAQAVAVRTYAWRQILVGRPDYDVTDWANFQMMCDERYPSSDLAVTMTAGQYLGAASDPEAAPIVAMYSAENGHPTLTNPNVGYLQAVPDLFALGKTRFGHGYGLSQWGAQRRALAGHNYRQILGHYYGNVYLQDSQDRQKPLGSLRTPLPGDWWNSGALRWSALTPAVANTVTVAISATQTLSTSVILSGTSGHWRSPQPLPPGSIITATLWVSDTVQEQVALPVDLQAPVPPTVTISAQADTAFSLTVTAEAAARISLREAWVWLGEQLHHTPSSGRVISDTAAGAGVAWAGVAGVDQAGVWYGPYTTVLPAPRSYRALFWLRVAAPLTATTPLRPLARLDVTDAEGATILGLRDLWLSDIVTNTRYQPIAVDFHLFAPAQGIEFRVAWPGTVNLALDQVEVWTLPSSLAPDTPLAWQWQGGAWPPRLQLAAFDLADNLSAPITLTLPITDKTPPLLTLEQTALPTNTVRLFWQASDDRSGVTQVEVQQQVAADEWQSHAQSPFTAASGAVNFQLNPAQPLPVRLRATDRAGKVGPWVELILHPATQWLYLPVVKK